MDDPSNQIILCQRSVHEMQQFVQRLERRMDLNDQKISHVSLNLAQRNEDLLQTIEKYTPLKLFREETTYIRNYIETKSKSFQDQNDLNHQSLNKQMVLLKEDYTLQNQSAVEKLGRMTKDILFQMESMQKQVIAETQQQIEVMTRKAADMENNFMNLFAQKHKLLERLTTCQESQNAKINLFENVIQQHNSTIQKFNSSTKYQTATPLQSGKRLNFDTHEIPIDMLKRQEDALYSVTQSLLKIEKKLAETDSKPKLRRELSFDQFSIQLSNNKEQQQQQQQKQYFTQQAPSKQSFAAAPEESQFKQVSESSSTPGKKELNLNQASHLGREEKSPVLKSNRDISKSPILKKYSPKPIVSSPITNMYDDIRIQKEYEQKMSQIKQEEQLQKSRKQMKQNELDNRLHQMRKSMSVVSNDSSLMKNDSFFLKNESQMMRDSQLSRNESQQQLFKNDSMDFKKSSSGLKGLMASSKEREKNYAPSNRDLIKRNNQKVDLSPPKQQLSHHSGKKSRTNQMKSLMQQQKMDQSAEEVIYQLDEEGYLMDEQGNYLLDEQGNYIMVSEQDLEELKKQNLVVEQ